MSSISTNEIQLNNNDLGKAVVNARKRRSSSLNSEGSKKQKQKEEKKRKKIWTVNDFKKKKKSVEGDPDGGGGESPSDDGDSSDSGDDDFILEDHPYFDEDYHTKICCKKNKQRYFNQYCSTINGKYYLKVNNPIKTNELLGVQAYHLRNRCKVLNVDILKVPIKHKVDYIPYNRDILDDKNNVKEKCIKDKVHNTFIEYGDGLLEKTIDPDFKTEAIKDWKKIVRELCEGNEEITEYYIAWLAHIVVKPNERSNISFMFINSKQGIGKDLSMKPFKIIFGNNLVQHANLKNVLSTKLKKKSDDKDMTLLMVFSEPDSAIAAMRNKGKDALSSSFADLVVQPQNIHGINSPCRAVFFCNKTPDPNIIDFKSRNRKYILLEPTGKMVMTEEGKSFMPKYFRKYIENDDDIMKTTASLYQYLFSLWKTKYSDGVNWNEIRNRIECISKTHIKFQLRAHHPIKSFLFTFTEDKEGPIKIKTKELHTEYNRYLLRNDKKISSNQSYFTTEVLALIEALNLDGSVKVEDQPIYRTSKKKGKSYFNFEAQSLHKRLRSHLLN